MTAASSDIPGRLGRLSPVLLILLCCGCVTPMLWSQGAGGNVRVRSVEGAVVDEVTGEPTALVLRCEGSGLAGGTWYAVLPLAANGTVAGAQGQQLAGRTFREIQNLHRQPVEPEVFRAADQLRDRVRVTRELPQTGPLLQTHGALHHLASGYVVLTFWEPGEPPDPPTRVEAMWGIMFSARNPTDPFHRPFSARTYNLVEIVHEPMWGQARPPYVAVLPTTFRRSAAGRLATGATAVALTPATLLADAAVVVTAPVWLPIVFAQGLRGGTIVRVPPDPRHHWRVPLVWPGEADGEDSELQSGS